MNTQHNLPQKWESLRSEDIGRLEEELARETCPGHPLHQVSAQALYRRYPFSDVLFIVQDDDYPYYCVHLTWSEETKPLWPYITRFRSIDDFCDNYEMTLQVDDDDPRWEAERWRFYEPE